MAKSTSALSESILDFIHHHPLSSSSEVHDGIGKIAGYATVKRMIQELLTERQIMAVGKGRATRYRTSPYYELLTPIDMDNYFLKEIDEREIKAAFDLQLIQTTLKNASLFSEREQKKLDQLQETFTRNIESLRPEEYQKEFERLAVDLSWKSSQIEGNTYTLLETERLLKERETAAGKTKEEAIMLLNHKAALDFILEQPDYIQPLTTACIEDIHSILIRDLNIGRNIRRRRVGISGTNYLPLDNEFQIREALDETCSLINQHQNVFEKALLALLLISYIQPFADGNKRTARIMSNAILIHYKHCPLSFRTVSSIDYKKAMLVFYEQNNISPFKRIFIEQFEFAVQTYF